MRQLVLQQRPRRGPLGRGQGIWLIGVLVAGFSTLTWAEAPVMTPPGRFGPAMAPAPGAVPRSYSGIAGPISVARTPLRCLNDAWSYVRVEFLSQMFRHSSTHPRYLGPGQPLVGTSWRNRPLHAGWFVGTLFPGDLVEGQVTQDESLFGGYQLGWDFDHYWGGQWRIGWSNPEVHILDQPQLDGNAELLMTDLDLLYYPWGDSTIRPYATLGVGLTSADFRDGQGVHRDGTLFSLPFGGGVKHHYRRWLSWRVELVDNLAFGDEAVDTMHNLSLTFGVEVHFGVRPGSYYPWNPSRHVW